MGWRLAHTPPRCRGPAARGGTKGRRLATWKTPWEGAIFQNIVYNLRRENFPYALELLIASVYKPAKLEGRERVGTTNNANR